MANGGNKEHRMVFDVRGKRRGVVKVVYAMLALLMGLSLFLLGFGGSLSSIFGSNNGSGTSAATQYIEQSERIERKLVKDPEDSQLLANLTVAQVRAGNASVDPATGEPTLESVQQLQEASNSWSKYLKATKEPSPATAQLMATALFGLAGTSRTTTEAKANIDAATEAQRIYAEGRPTLNSLSVLALYSLYSGDQAQAEKAKKETIALTTSKPQRENFENQYEEIEKRAGEFEKQVKEAAKAEKAGAEANPEASKNPFGGLGGSSLSE